MEPLLKDYLDGNDHVPDYLIDIGFDAYFSHTSWICTEGEEGVRDMRLGLRDAFLAMLKAARQAEVSRGQD